MVYDHESRIKFIEDYKKQWNLRLAGQPEEVLDIVRYVETPAQYPEVRRKISQEVRHIQEQEDCSPSAMMKEYYGELVSWYVPEDKRAQYFALIDRLYRFTSYGGICSRGGSHVFFTDKIFELLSDYKVLEFYGGNLAAYLIKDLSGLLWDIRVNTSLYRIRRLDILVAAAIDEGDGKVLRIVRAMLEGGEHAAEPDYELLSGIMKSSDRTLQEAVGQMLLAAGMQDGLRQKIVRAACNGTPEAFVCIFDCIFENRLFRFGSVRIALMECLNVWDSKGLELMTGKYSAFIQEALHHRKKAVEYCGSSDRFLVYIGLWALSVYNCDNVINILRGFQREGTKPQLMVMAYFNKKMWSDKACRQVAERVLCDERRQQDLELVAAYWSSYCLDSREYLNKAVSGGKDDSVCYHKVPPEIWFADEGEARQRVRFLRRLLDSLQGKDLQFNPCVFPWHRAKITVSGVMKQLCVLAHLLQDRELSDYLLDRIQDVKKDPDTGSRAEYVELLLHDPSERSHVDRLVSLVADKESDTQDTAARLLKGVALEDYHYEILEGFLRLKNGGIRRNAIGLLKGQRKERIPLCAERLIRSGDRRMREGALDLILEVIKGADPGSVVEAQTTEQLRTLAAQIKDPKENEKILLQQILVEEGEEPAGTEQEGFGLYQKDTHIKFPGYTADRQAVISYFTVEREAIDGILLNMTALIRDYVDRLYTTRNGEEIRFDDYLTGSRRWLPGGEIPFREVWTDFYEKEIGDVRILTVLTLCLCDNNVNAAGQEAYQRWNHDLYGAVVADYALPESIRMMRAELGRMLEILTGIYGQGELGRIGLELLKWILEDMQPEEMWYQLNYSGVPGSSRSAYIETGRMRRIRRAIEEGTGKEWFIKRFFVYAQLDDKYCLQENKGKRYDRFTGNSDLLDLPDYVKACSHNIIEEEAVYRNIFEKWGLSYACDALGSFEETQVRWPWKERMQKLRGGTEEEEKRFMETGHRICTRLTERILEEELKRGEMPTVFSESISSVGPIYGIDCFVRILKALGDEKLVRRGRINTGKRECLSHLLSVCVPQEGDNAERLRELLGKDSSGKAVVSSRRLVEAGMYASQWLDILEECLGIHGLKSGGYYFIAHMDEWFGEARRAVIARYTPLTVEELRMGAFDCEWFRQVYEMLGEEWFSLLYDAAKYISDGSRHVRARKYADAALGKVSVEQVEAEITARRNKDTLMSYGLIPFRDKKDMLHRYEFIRQFLKESRNFGSMRQASEAEAVKMALRNMASAAGYADTMRLTLAMEGEMAREYEEYREWHEVEDIRIRIEINEYGAPLILCEKEGRILKSVPARLKKNEWVLSLSQVYKKLKEQSRRCIRLFEQAMAEGEIFRHEELAELCGNPVAKPVIHALVFITKESDQGGSMVKRYNGYFAEKGLTDAEGGLVRLEPDMALRVAHPVELYREGVLETYQRGCYDKLSSGMVKIQPFKQIFREFYVKLEEELEQGNSHMFEGYQVEPRKALACLKGRGWIADVREGIQKVCYGTNILARIIVLSDWITAEDLMTPSIDWIDFYDRMNNKVVCVKEVPDIVYSEVMRDVDLAVSISYAGGVDPETCRSSIEMRKVIAECHLELFGLKNVEFAGNHAVITGKRGSYTVHLGSGMVHRRGGPQIDIRAVPAQRRGRIFLPYVDEDPKTAEILSKIILFAQDDKIRDTEILRQIQDVCLGG